MINIDNFFKIGVSKNDNENTRLQKASIVIIPLVMIPASLIWSAIYFYYENYFSALIPLSYSIISLINLYYFNKTKSVSTILNTQMTLVLFIPFILMWSLGGFAQGSYVIIWSFFAPIAALIHNKSSKSLYWFYSFITLSAFSTIIDPWLIQHSATELPQRAIEIFFFLNISVALSGVYFLIKYFIDEKEKNDNELLYNNLSYLQSYKDNIDKHLIVTKTDLDGKITFANENFYKTSGFSKDEVLGKTHKIIRHPNNQNSLFKKLWETISSKKTWQGRLQNMKKDGSSYWIDTTISPILNKDNEIVEYIAIRHDVSKLLRQQDELTKMLYTDQLTGLNNRNALIKALKDENELTLIVMDIDRFSQINDLYGTDFGNKVLIEFTTLLQNTLSKNSTCKLFRFDGDVFALLSTKTDTTQLIDNITELITQMAHEALIVDDEEILLSITAGISSEQNDLLLSTANMALKSAKKESKDIIIYNENLSLTKEYKNNMKWIKKIKEAIKEDRITTYFQPIANNDNDNSINKYEALIRLIDTNGDIITPYFFLEIAKKAKLYGELTKIVIKKSFEAFKDNNYEFSVNITIDDILDEEIKEYIYKSLANSKISNRLTFEITETESIGNFDDVEKFINRVKSYGCKIAIDDFGTGYSNFEHLMRIQADYIKIDGSIIKEIIHDKKSELITSVIVSFAKEMNIQTIGEYVENEAIHDKLKELGVNKSQGYYFDRPKALLS